jgi:hypothetical protein
MAHVALSFFAGASMIETNIQQQQDHVSKQPSLHEPGLKVEANMTVTCAICDAVYAPSPQQVPFLQYTQGALEATFMSVCHFCFRCRRAACPQCWDDVHGVCGACVQDARLPFRTAATPLDDLTFPPTPQQSSHQSQQQQAASLFAPIHNGRFSTKTAARPDTVTDPAVQPVVAQAITFDNHVRESEQYHTPAAIAAAIPIKTLIPEVPQDTRKQEKKPPIATEAKKTSRLELVFTWIVLVIVLLLVVVIALAEFIPAVNALVAHGTHIDIHAEIAYLVSIVRQLFKR